MSDARRAIMQLLTDWRDAGLTHAPHVDVANVSQIAANPAVAIEPAPQPPEDSVISPVPSKRAAAHSSELPTTASDAPRDERAKALADLATVVSRCERCRELAQTRTQTVFGVGNPEASVMFVGEAPGADEDAQGEPFVGRAGQLLDKIIAACGWKREDIYICNILRCRPPGNRNPTTEEAANCREYLDGQIRIVDPDYIVCWGSVAAHNLLDETTPIGKLRQKWFKYGRAKVLCTYHPSYLLRNPAAKKPVWEDMKFLLSEMGLKPPAT